MFSNLSFLPHALWPSQEHSVSLITGKSLRIGALSFSPLCHHLFSQAHLFIFFLYFNWCINYLQWYARIFIVSLIIFDKFMHIWNPQNISITPKSSFGLLIRQSFSSCQNQLLSFLSLDIHLPVIKLHRVGIKQHIFFCVRLSLLLIIFFLKLIHWLIIDMCGQMTLTNPQNFYSHGKGHCHRVHLGYPG